MNPVTRQVTLKAEVGTDPIAGRVFDEQGTNVAFSGWLELAAALERLLGAPGPADTATGPMKGGS